jgi:hypothetical protein
VNTVQRIQLPLRRLVERAVVGSAGIVDQIVEPDGAELSERLLDLLHEVIERSRAADVELKGNCPATGAD